MALTQAETQGVMRVLYAPETHQDLALLTIGLLLKKYPGEFDELGKIVVDGGKEVIEPTPLGEKIIQAVYEEDCCGNFFNHFRHGVTGAKLIGGQHDALQWAKGGGGSLTNPYSWDDAIELYSQGLKADAYEALGHVLHLLQDMAQPGHTHLDAHPAGAYETMVKDNFTAWAPSVEGLITLQPIIPSSLDTAFQGVAKLSYKANRFAGDNLFWVSEVENDKGMFERRQNQEEEFLITEIWNKKLFGGTPVQHTRAGKFIADDFIDLLDDFWETRLETGAGSRDEPGYYYIENPNKAVPEFYVSALTSQEIPNDPFSPKTLTELIARDMLPMAIQHGAGLIRTFKSQTTPVAFVGLTINGPSGVFETSTAQYTATANFSDGSTEVITPQWSLSSSIASISDSGVLNAGSVSTNTGLTVKATFTINSVTKTAEKPVTIIDAGDGSVVATPTITPNGGTFSGSVSVTLATTTPGAEIRYTLNGSNPTALSQLYIGTFTLYTTGTVKAKAFKTGLTGSPVASASFTISGSPTTVATPTITPNGGTFSGSVSVTLATTTLGADIRYTTDGSDPDIFSKWYTGSFSLTKSAPVKAKAFKSGMTESSIAVASFTSDSKDRLPAPGNVRVTVLSESQIHINWTYTGPVPEDFRFWIQRKPPDWWEDAYYLDESARYYGAKVASSTTYQYRIRAASCWHDKVPGSGEGDNCWSKPKNSDWAYSNEVKTPQRVINFGQVAVGETKELTVRITADTCSTDRRHCGLRYTWESPEWWRVYGRKSEGHFSLPGESAWNLPAREQQTIELRVSFTPQEPGEHRAVLHEYRVWNGAVGAQREISIVGTATLVLPAIINLLLD